MDYGKSGNPKLAKDLFRHKSADAKTDAAKSARPSKEELLARMKAAAEAKKKP
jgi:hypothetical protein